MIHLIRYSVLLFVCTCLIGCGNGNQKLGGKVVFSDGEPLNTGTIYFSSPTFFARANIRPDGAYDVGSLSDRDGLPPGAYKVFIVGAFESGQPSTDSSKENLIPLVAPEFTSEANTPLSIEVPGERVYDITVERPKRNR